MHCTSIPFPLFFFLFVLLFYNHILAHPQRIIKSKIPTMFDFEAARRFFLCGISKVMEIFCRFDCFKLT